ncbi:uncharacterized protein LOC132293828 [Cornus florida]|uniref:uncharacterized protein LOC132293828 n=1 Tax=Cornus florida TaxID=4283 RepID=UPI0028A19A90|nr:uncharacterized protein LOC132293828 [Cornus florida]XP_059647460.1 uncharacterized protein LOC132293828 [Cornus florida]
MGTSNNRDLLTSFSPALDFLAISSGDGRIKIWDTSKGQLQIEFTDIVSNDGVNLLTKPGSGHLSVDYTCMKWLSLDKKKKRKLGSSLLVLGTGSGDVLALDVSAGQLKWRVSDCHPGGVTAISFPTDCSCIYTAGTDGIICELDSMTGNLLGKFKASTKAISSMSVSPDGMILATAAAQLKIFNCSEHKKIQKFSGHPGAVRCMIFTKNTNYILSSAVGERYVAVWRIDGSKKQSASCVLAMDHPAVFLDSRCINTGDVDEAGVYVLAISEMGICYFWYGKNIEELRNAKPTKVSLYIDNSVSRNQKGAVPTIFAAKLQGVARPASAHVFVAYGSLIKPSFEKILVHSGTDIKLNSSSDGILLPIHQSHRIKKGIDVQNEVTALDRANAEDALCPMPKIFDFHEKKKRDQNSSIDPEEMTADNLVNEGGAMAVANRDDVDNVGIDNVRVCMEDRLRTLGILNNKDDLTSNSVFDSTMLKGISLEANMPQRKMRAAVLSMVPSDAYGLLKVLVSMWLSRSCSGNYVLPWICCILVNHSDYVISQEPVTQVFDSLYKLSKSKGVAIQSLLQLSGRLQLVTAQIHNAAHNTSQIIAQDDQMDESDNDDVDEFLYGEDDEESQNSGSDDD